jgi:hypothetical protein
MSDVMIVSTGTYRFDGGSLEAAGARTWPGLRSFTDAGPADGHLQHVDEHNDLLDVVLLQQGEGLGVESSPQRVAEFMAWLTQQPAFPDDGTVTVYNWALDVMPLFPRTAADDLLAVAQP